MKQKTGLLCVISSPSGGGKTTIIREVLVRNPEYQYSISATTRPKRKNEKDGVDYYFLTEEEFDRYIQQDEFVEWAEVHGFRYGTLKKTIAGILAKGQVVLLDIDVVGGKNVRTAFPHQSFLIFLKPPSIEELKRRLIGRQSEKTEEIEKRLTRVPMEMAYAEHYDVEIVNKNFEETVKQVEQKIQEYRYHLEDKQG